MSKDKFDCMGGDKSCECQQKKKKLRENGKSNTSREFAWMFTW